MKKCKNCRLRCDFKELQLSSDPEATCIVPAMRVDAIANGTDVVSWSDDKIKSYINQILQLYTNVCLNKENFEVTEKKREQLQLKRLNTLFNKLMTVKEKYYPTVQKNLNVNVNIFENQLNKWRETRKEIIVIGDKKEVTENIDEDGNYEEGDEKGGEKGDDDGDDDGDE